MYGMTHTRFVPSTPADFEELGRWDWLDFARKKDMKGLTESERKFKRAKKVRKKGNRRRAARIEMRAGAREMKEKGKKPLTLKSSPEKLWAVKYPWAQRPGQKGKAVLHSTIGTGTGPSPEKLTQPIAKGMRPLAMYRKREWRTTILGGLKALQAAGVPGYDMGAMPDIEMLKPSAKGKDDKQLKAYGGGKKSLSGAAGFIRQEVIDNDLEEAAWAFRGMLMMQPAVVSAGIRAGVASVTAGIMAVTPIAPFAVIPAAAAAAEGAHATILQNDMKNFQQLAEQGLQRYGAQRAKEAAEVETARINQETQDLIDQEAAAVQAAGEAQAKTYVYVAYGALGLVSIVTLILIRRAVVSRRAA